MLGNEAFMGCMLCNGRLSMKNRRIAPAVCISSFLPYGSRASTAVCSGVSVFGSRHSFHCPLTSAQHLYRGFQRYPALCLPYGFDRVQDYPPTTANPTAALKLRYAVTMSAAVNWMRVPSKRVEPGSSTALSAISVVMNSIATMIGASMM